MFDAIDDCFESLLTELASLDGLYEVELYFAFGPEPDHFGYTIFPTRREYQEWETRYLEGFAKVKMTGKFVVQCEICDPEKLIEIAGFVHV